MKSFSRWLLVQIPLGSPQTTVRMNNLTRPESHKSAFGKPSNGSPCPLQAFVLKVDGPESWLQLRFKQWVFLVPTIIQLGE